MYGDTPEKAADGYYTYEFQYWTLPGKTSKVTNFRITSDKSFQAKYAKTAIEYTLTIDFNGILKPNGTQLKQESTTQSGKFSASSGWSFTQKKFDNLVGNFKDLSAYGVQYKYTGQWKNNDTGEIFSGTFRIGYGGTAYDHDVHLSFSPVYDKTPIWWLDYYYVDNVSTGSGSWSNLDSLFNGYSHTFSDPSIKTPVSHYKFVNWLNTDDGSTYGDSDVYSYPSAYMTPGTKKEVYVNAQWQPSITVNYFNWNGEALGKPVESFEGVDVYASGEYEAIEGADFLGWYDADGNRIEEGTVFDAPEITTEPNQEKVVNAYARYSTSYTVQHAKQNVDDDEYTVDEDATETIEGALLGSSVKADPKTFEGFTYKSEVEGTVAQAVINEDFIKTFLETGIALKLFYNRNVHSVTYAYDGYVPADATGLPDPADYRYGAAVKVAADATATGYRFSGWDRADFDMPDEDVVVTGSFEAIPYTVTYVYDGTVPAGASALPKAATYTYGDTVDVAAAATASGYTFSGWDRTGSFAMPAQDVVIHGSFTAIPAAPTPTPDPDPATDDGTVNPGPANVPAVTPAPAAPVAPVAAAIVPALAAPAAPAPAAIADDATPLAQPATDAIDDDATPLAALGAWSLFDLLATILTAIVCIVLLVRAIGRSKRDDEEDEEQANVAMAAEDQEEEDEAEIKRHRMLRIASLVPAIAAIVLFILTQDLTQPMVIFDSWSIVFAIIAIVQLVVAFLARKKEEDPEDEDREQQGYVPAAAAA